MPKSFQSASAMSDEVIVSRELLALNAQKQVATVSSQTKRGELAVVKRADIAVKERGWLIETSRAISRSFPTFLTVFTSTHGAYHLERSPLFQTLRHFQQCRFQGKAYKQR